MSDYYSILGLTKNASHDDIRQAYRREAFKWHPDKNPSNPEAEEVFKTISEAYSVLSNIENRSLYDDWLHSKSADETQSEESFSFSQQFNYNAASEIFIQEMFRIAYELTMRNISSKRIAPELIKKGCPNMVAIKIAKIVQQQRKAMVRKFARKLFLRSILMIIGGIIMTLVLLRFGFIVFLGPILIAVGIFNFFRAIYFVSSGRIPKKALQ